MKKIMNPILRGANPDPSILRVENDYYIATSTFTWFPGIALHHSRDLIHWKLIGYALTRESQLNMKGLPSTCGVWAPCLTHSNGIFYLVYTERRSYGTKFGDCNNYLITATDILGPWTDPIYLNGSGIDPSLFHDDDGTKWIVNMMRDFRFKKPNEVFMGIVLQQYSIKEKRLIGTPTKIFEPTALGCTEGPHIYKNNGYYYLIVAEGGTGYDHAVTVARSKFLTGPYEVDPSNPMLTSKNSPELTLQKAGHASLVETNKGEWYMAHLCSRPLDGLRSILGRETSLQKVQWNEENWLRLAHAGNHPSTLVDPPEVEPYPFDNEPFFDHFDEPNLKLDWNSLRHPVNESWASLTARPGYLRLRGRESLSSFFEQSLIARRQQSFHCEAMTCLEFEPTEIFHLAGLVSFYDANNYIYLCVTFDEKVGKCLKIIECDNGKIEIFDSRQIVMPENIKIYLKITFFYKEFHLYHSLDNQNWKSIGPTFDASKLSDEYIRGGGFTGNFIGICAQDLNGKHLSADFDYFIYNETI